MNVFGARKSISALVASGGPHTLKKALSWPHLVALGVGAIVGTGIYTLVGVGAGFAGPGVMLAFVIAGVVCACAALCYAELATSIPASGSAYTYSYAALGKRVAWVVGWSLILEYTVVCAAVAVGWAGYVKGFLEAAHVPSYLLAGPGSGGAVNLPAVVIIVLVAAMLLRGTRESATVNLVLVSLKIAALALFVALTLPHFNAAHFTPFMPHGFFATVENGQTVGVMAAAAIVFFAFYGFDAVTTAAEEAHEPERDLRIGIIGSMVVCTVIYMAVIAAALGAMPYTQFMSAPDPLAHILTGVGAGWAGTLLAVVVIVALPTVILAFMFGQSRIFFAMARDGMLPRRFGRVSEKSGTPVVMTIVTAVVVSLIAAFLPLGEIAALANAGTLCAFTAVAIAVLALRRSHPDLRRSFRTPLAWLVAPVTVVGCAYLFFSLPGVTRWNFLAWNVLGVIVYLVWARHGKGHDEVAQGMS
jgi:APA family basic amino acid/polyamine antiporter